MIDILNSFIGLLNSFLLAVILALIITWTIFFVIIPFLSGFFEKQIEYLKKMLKL